MRCTSARSTSTRSTPAILLDLAERIRAIESSPRSSARALPSALLAPLLSGQALSAHSLVELLPTTEGAGVWTLALLLAGDACGEESPEESPDEPHAPFRGLRALAKQTRQARPLVIVDPRQEFYPPAALRLGINLERTIVVHPRSRAEAHLVFDQCLRCAAVGAVMGVCDRLRGVESQRFKWAVEAGGGLGLVIRSAGEERGPSFADLRLRIAPLASPDTCRRLRIETLRWRGGREGTAQIVEIDDETGDVRVSAELAAAETGTPASRAARPGRRSG